MNAGAPIKDDPTNENAVTAAVDFPRNSRREMDGWFIFFIGFELEI